MELLTTPRTTIAVFIGELSETIRQLARSARRDGAADDFHRLRVAIKRLRALAAHARDTGNTNQTDPPRRLLRRLFRAAGRVRNCHVRKQRIIRHWELSPDSLSEYFNDLTAHEAVARHHYDRVARAHEARMFQSISERMMREFERRNGDDLAQRSVHSILSLLDLLVGADLNSTEINFHTVRILAKETRYRIEFVRDCVVSLDVFDRLGIALRDVHRALGLWHDRDESVYALDAFIARSENATLLREPPYAQFRLTLLREGAAALNCFFGKWMDLKEQLPAFRLELSRFPDRQT
ncbi:MAG TPA: CHAD domain-containing protein [candidate division Zixibacteria bacterium]|jgi:CHAD domain-containing protein